jgi:hypothetical protein
MTLCIGLKYPWGVMGGINPPLGARSTAIILATDSRWVFGKANSAPVDKAQKLFPIARNAVAVYAGASELAEECIRKLKYLAPQPSSSKRTLNGQMVQKRFMDTYQEYVADRRFAHGKPDVDIMIGVFEEPFGGELIRFRSSSDFAPEKTEGIQTIGVLGAGQMFRQEFQHIVKSKSNQASSHISRIKVADVFMWIAAALEKVKASEYGKVIEGWTECVVIDKSGVYCPNIKYTTDPTNEGPGFTRVTPHKGEIGTTEQMLRYNITDDR